MSSALRTAFENGDQLRALDWLGRMVKRFAKMQGLTFGREKPLDDLKEIVNAIVNRNFHYWQVNSWDRYGTSWRINSWKYFDEQTPFRKFLWPTNIHYVNWLKSLLPPKPKGATILWFVGGEMIWGIDKEHNLALEYLLKEANLTVLFWEKEVSGSQHDNFRRCRYGYPPDDIYITTLEKETRAEKLSKKKFEKLYKQTY